MKSTTDLEKTLVRLNLVSPSFCLAKWKNATIHLHNGHTQSCHHVRSHPFQFDPKNPSSLHNSRKKQFARQQMLRGQRPRECEYCWKVENKGELSDRVHKSSESVYSDFFQEALASREGTHIQPSFLEISFDNICQFRCMYCSPAYSTQWEKEVAEFGDYPTLASRLHKKIDNSRRSLPKSERDKNIQYFWQWWPELRQHLRYLRITGGEPLMSRETFRLIEDLVEHPQPQLRFAINSNLGFQEEKISQFLIRMNALQEATKEVLIFTSIDSIGEQAEYIRYGLKEADLYRNVEKILDQALKPITLCFMITVNIFSLPGILGLLKKIQRLKTLYPQHTIQFDAPYLRQPELLSVELLTPDFRNYLREAECWLKSDSTFSEAEIQKITRIIPLVANSEKNSAIKFLLRKDLVRFIREYDRRKNLDFKKTFPEYRDFLSLCESDAQNFRNSFVDKNI